MTARADPAPCGAYSPDPFVRTILAVTRALPANWLGLRASMLLRRLAIDWLGDRPVDTTVWNARVRLYPARNSCEKVAAFTPQMYDVSERALLGAALDERARTGEIFSFVDIGANVGLYSLFVASRGGGQARVLAIEPQPGIVERLSFNLAANPEVDVVVIAAAVGERDGDAKLVIDPRDSGGTHLSRDADTAGAETVRVPCRPLVAILDEAGVARIDALKIDIEGAEDQALAPFLREAARERLPRLILIEDRPDDWAIDLYGLLRERGYALAARSKHNAAFRLA